MKVLIVTHDSNFSGGANRSLYANIIELQNRYGMEILVLLPDKNGQLNQKLDELAIRWMHIPYFGAVSGLRHDGKDGLRRMKVYLGYYIEKYGALRMLKKLSKEQIDLVYTNTRLPMIGANISRLLGVPHVMHVREFGTVEPLWGKWDFKAIYRHTDRIILISRALKEQFLQHVAADKLVVSHNGINYDSVTYVKNDLQGQEVHLIITGRLVPDKGQKDAIQALHKIITHKLLDKKIILHLVGSSPKRTHIQWYEAELRDLVAALSLKEHVIFEGETEDMHGMRSMMDMELVCSICETFGRVTVEAMRSGLFVIGSNSGGTPELIRHGYNGMLYRPGDSDDLAAKIVEALHDTGNFNKIRENALFGAADNYTVETNCRDIYNIMDSCLEARNQC